ncbi:PLAT/LH2 domain-containing protein [Streptomyces rimosus]|uniref:PLAT/LH2 domain-containing protein n=1 Tax=Streptomyces rimosus TaxID=1927 RepID=UPI0004C9BBAD|nr:PLAT/LH2 domain-containing protein [Streptomyces rimosus]
MADITRIDVRLMTANEEGAGTNGWVFLDIAGREFHIDSTRNDFEASDDYTYTFGTDANVLEPGRNDPRFPQLDTDDLDRYAVRLRFEPNDNDDDWGLERVTVTVNPTSSFPARFDNPTLISTGTDKRIWLGRRFGKAVRLRRY